MSIPKFVIIGGEKLIHRVGYLMDNLQSRMERWEIANGQKMQDLELNEWIRIVSAIGHMSIESASLLYYALFGDYQYSHPSSWREKELVMPDKITKEFLMSVRLPLSNEDYQLLKSRESEWYPHKLDNDLIELDLAYCDMCEWEKLNDPNYSGSYLGEGGL